MFITFFLMGCSKSDSGGTGHPWQMFRGGPGRTGYAVVTGPQTGVLKWKFDVKQGSTSQSPPNSIAVSSDGTIYVAGVQKAYALDRSGNQKWNYGVTDTIQGPAISNDGNTIYFAVGSPGSGGGAAGGKGYVLALDKSGNKVWQFSAGSYTLFGPNVGPDGTIYQGSWDGYVYALDASGALKWKYKTDQGCVSYPVTLGSDGIVYVGGGDTHCGGDPNLYALGSDGTLKWKYNTGRTRVGTPTFHSDGTLVVSADPDLLNLSASGSLNWKLGAPPDPPAAVGIQTAAVGFGSIAYTANSQGLIQAVDLGTHKVKWSYQGGADPNNPGDKGLPSFPVVDSKGNVYQGSVDHKMYGIDANGKLLFSYTSGGKISEASPALDSDGTLYFSAEDGYIYALTGGT